MRSPWKPDVWILLYDALMMFSITASETGVAELIYLSDPENGTIYKVDLEQDGELVSWHTKSRLRPFITVDTRTDSVLFSFRNNYPFIFKYSYTTKILDQIPTGVSPVGLAVDPIWDLIYYTATSDGHIGIIGKRRGHDLLTKIFNDKIHSPSAIDLDPIKGYMYWADVGTQPYIGRSYMDGSQAEIIISANLSQIEALAVHGEEVFWCHGPSVRIERARGDGTNRTILLERPGDRCRGLAVDDKYVYWIGTETRGIHRVDLAGTEATSLCRNISAEIIAIGKSYQDGTAAKTKQECECDHLCIPTPRGRACRCSERHTLSTDGHSCTKLPLHRGVLYSRYPEVYALDIDQEVQFRLPLSVSSGQSAMVYDPLEDCLVWVDDSHTDIKKVAFEHLLSGQLITNKTETIYSNAESRFDGLALDVRRRLLYVTDSAKQVVTEVSLGGQARTLISGNIKEPGPIALDSANGLIYWADSRHGVGGVRIERASTSGGGRQTIRNIQMRYIDLTFDPSNLTLYWTDRITETDGRNLYRVMRQDPGSDAEVVVSSHMYSYTGLTVGNDLLFTTGVNQTDTFRKLLMHNLTDGTESSIRLRVTPDFLYYCNRSPGNTFVAFQRERSWILPASVGSASAIIVVIIIVGIICRYRSIRQKTRLPDRGELLPLGSTADRPGHPALVDGSGWDRAPALLPRPGGMLRPAPPLPTARGEQPGPAAASPRKATDVNMRLRPLPSLPTRLRR